METGRIRAPFFFWEIFFENLSINSILSLNCEHEMY